jgi:hypothetical protein
MMVAPDHDARCYLYGDVADPKRIEGPAAANRQVRPRIEDREASQGLEGIQPAAIDSQTGGQDLQPPVRESRDRESAAQNELKGDK